MANLNDIAASDMSSVIVTEDTGRAQVTYTPATGDAFTPYAVVSGQTDDLIETESGLALHMTRQFLFAAADIEDELGRGPGPGDSVTYNGKAYTFIDVRPSMGAYSLRAGRSEAQDSVGEQGLRKRAF